MSVPIVYKVDLRSFGVKTIFNRKLILVVTLKRLDFDNPGSFITHKRKLPLDRILLLMGK